MDNLSQTDTSMKVSEPSPEYLGAFRKLPLELREMIYSHLIPQKVNLTGDWNRSALANLSFTNKTTYFDIKDWWKRLESIDPALNYTKELGFIDTKNTIFVVDVDKSFRRHFTREVRSWLDKIKRQWGTEVQFVSKDPSPLLLFTNNCELDVTTVGKVIKRLELNLHCQDDENFLEAGRGLNHQIVEYILRSAELQLETLDVGICWPFRPEVEIDYSFKEDSLRRLQEGEN